MQRQARGEAPLEQAAQALGVVLERTVEAVELVGQQARFAGQVGLACGEVGVVQRTQGKQGTAGNHQRQHDGKGDTEL
ncbi:hypothetical protein D3C76_1254450 [compost metagenome]